MRTKDEPTGALDILIEIKDVLSELKHESHMIFRLIAKLNMNKPPDFPYYTSEEFRNIVNRSPRTERRWRHDGVIPFIKKKGQVLYEKRKLFGSFSKRKLKKQA